MATYTEVKSLEHCPDKLLIDVREPNELVEDGKIPFSINIPCELIKNSLRYFEDILLIS